MKFAHNDDVDPRLRSKHSNLTINPHGESSLPSKQTLQAKITKPKGPVTADCYAAHKGPWSGCVTPKRPHHE